MTIEKYMKENPEWDIYMDCELKFAEPDHSKEAEENLNWVLDNEPDLQALAVVVKSYYGNTIEWERF